MDTSPGGIFLFLFFIFIALFAIWFMGQKEALEIEKKKYKPSVYNLSR